MWSYPDPVDDDVVVVSFKSASITHKAEQSRDGDIPIRNKALIQAKNSFSPDYLIYIKMGFALKNKSVLLCFGGGMGGGPIITFIKQSAVEV